MLTPVTQTHIPFNVSAALIGLPPRERYLRQAWSGLCSAWGRRRGASSSIRSIPVAEPSVRFSAAGSACAERPPRALLYRADGSALGSARSWPLRRAV
eukprot:scaffold7714_cov390-Prasinococcus_capsulatus_cf.AAC.9